MTELLSLVLEVVGVVLVVSALTVWFGWPAVLAGVGVVLLLVAQLPVKGGDG